VGDASFKMNTDPDADLNGSMFKVFVPNKNTFISKAKQDERLQEEM
jgi:hypothetical protein